jgi:hypothetical protein
MDDAHPSLTDPIQQLEAGRLVVSWHRGTALAQRWCSDCGKPAARSALGEVPIDALQLFGTEHARHEQLSV